MTDKKKETAYKPYDFELCLKLLEKGVPPRVAAHASGIGHIVLDTILHDAEVTLQGSGSAEDWNEDEKRGVKLLMAMNRGLAELYSRSQSMTDSAVNGYLKNADEQGLYKLSIPTVSDKEKVERWDET